MPEPCDRCERLNAEVHKILLTLAELTQEQWSAFRSGEKAEFARLDAALENALGLKERRIGEFREHFRTHGREFGKESEAR